MVNMNFEFDNDEQHRAFKVKCINKGVEMATQVKKLIDRWVDDE